ncbi:MAG: hypothetical protein HYX39_12205 [Bacteroidetes bacterium]|nr:hypothetical protein [Bacteroidota bacterium]
MKSTLRFSKMLTVAFLIFNSSFLISQTFPYGINYQSVVRDANGNAKTNQQVPVQFTIYQTTSSGTMVWQERQLRTTNSMGQFNAVIGTGTPVTPFTAASFSQINWGNDSTFFKVEINSNISFTGVFSQIGNTTKFQAVPYALNAKTKAPTVQKFLSGSGNYSTPANVLYIKVRMVGGGGGGAGGGTGGGSGGIGGNTTFGTLTANGGSGGTQNNSPIGAGGTAAGGTIANIRGGNGTGGTAQVANLATSPAGGSGGSTPFGGAGGGSGATNSGAGGGGGSGNGATSSNQSAGAGGGGGGYIETFITPTPLQIFSYGIGTAGTAGSAGSVGSAGNAGGSGMVIVEEYY